MKDQPIARNKWRGATRTLGVLALLVMLLALAVGVSMAAPTSAPDAPAGKSSIGDCVWNDTNVDGFQSGEVGINGVLVNLYKDGYGGNPKDGVIQPTEKMSTTLTAPGLTNATGTACETAGYYDFPVDGDERYWVEIDPSNFNTGQPLEDYVFTSANTAGSNPHMKLMPLNQLDYNDADFGYVKVDLRISINPPTATNKVGDAHIFTVKVEKKIGSGAWTAVSGASPSVSYSPVPNTPNTSPVTCGPTNGSGECTVTINSTTPGVFTANASVTTNVSVNISDGIGGFVATNVSRTRATGDAKNTAAGGSGAATKTYVDLRILLSPLTDTNKVGDPHTFTATVQQNTGSGWSNVPNGTLVSFTLLNNSAGATFTAGSACTTTSGQCTITINGANAGSVDLQATSTVTVSSQSITRQTGTTANTTAGGTGNATKTYVDLRISLSPLTATNKVGDPHTFTAIVQQNTGSGWSNVPNGTLVSFTLLNNSAGATFTAGSACTTTSGQCTITINGANAGSVDLQATSTVTVSSQSITRQTGTTANTNAGGTGNATKIYVDLRISLSPLTDTNKVGDPHTFTAIVQQNTGSGWGNVPNGSLVSFVLLNNTAGATFTAGTSCTTTGGQCTITINGANAGSVDLQATSTVTVSSQSITRQTGTTANTTAGCTGNATKTYVDLRISLSPLTATNKVGDPHTFTATVQQNTGSAWSNVPNGTTVSFALLNNSAGGTFTAGNTCTTTGGQCTITINGANAGSVDVQATSTVTVSSQSITRQTGTTANTTAGGTGNATKTYVDLRISLSPLTATNAVNQPHTFTATVQQNTGSGWSNVPNGTTVVFGLLNNTASASFTAGNTCTTTGGQCTITINGTVQGSVDVQATSTVTVSGQSITRQTGTTANTNAGGTGNATKIYKSGSIGDFVWWDINKDGRQDSGEPGINDVTVRLFSNATCAAGAGQPVQTINTANGGSPATDGFYQFTGLGQGTYCVEILSTEFTAGGTLENWIASPKDAVGVPDDKDSDGDPTTKRITNIGIDPVAGPQNDPTRDFGFYKNSGHTVSKARVTDPGGDGVRINEPISFTITVVNTGTTWLEVVPISDTFNTTYIQFLSASISSVNTPPDTTVTNGVTVTKQWADITGAGSLAPGASIVLNVVFVGVGDTTLLPAQTPCTLAKFTCNQVSTTKANGEGPTVDPDGPSPTGPLPPLEIIPPKKSDAPVKVVNPTGVTLADYGAAITPNSVTVRWTTVNESEISGFDLYRMDSSRASVHIGYVEAAKAGQTSGTSYSLTDSSATYGVSYTYVLEAHTFSGGTEIETLAQTSWLWLANIVR